MMQSKSPVDAVTQVLERIYGEEDHLVSGSV